MLRTLIIEDEPDKRDSLKLMLERACPGQTQLVGEADSVPEAVKLIRNLKPDLVFLDVEIRLGTGFDVLSQLDAIDFAVIFTTAYRQYAVEAFRYEALDYLVKPVRSSLLREAVQRAASRKGEPIDMEKLKRVLRARPDGNRVGIASEEGVQLVEIAEIVRCEGEGSYTTFILTGGKRILTSRNLGKVEAQLAEKGFLKVHQSHLVNTAHIRQYLRRDGGCLLMSNGDEVPVSRRMRSKVQEWLDQL